MLTVLELTKLFESMKNSRWIWCVKFALVTGLRRGELLSLEWKDIDWDGRNITIDKSTAGDTKSAKEHYVPLSDAAVTYLREQLSMLKNEFNPIAINASNKIKRDLNNTEFLVFPAQTGGPVKPNTFYNTVRRFGKKVDIHAYPHCFRHTFVYFMRHKLSLKQLQDALGHDENTSTLDLYGNMFGNNVEAAKLIDDVFANVENEISKITNESIKNQDDKNNVIQFPHRRVN